MNQQSELYTSSKQHFESKVSRGERKDLLMINFSGGLQLGVCPYPSALLNAHMNHKGRFLIHKHSRAA